MALPQTQNSGDDVTPSSFNFKRFDVVSDHSDHHFSLATMKDNYGVPAHKRITKEWRILENNLPDNIYVRVYDTRINLLRAVIVGAAGTPYHDALFFFDVSFPPHYPAHPPKVHYRSYGLRVNPNLYDSGYVCLSLLNTWTGKKNEMWDPAHSTVLQVLLSIQALVLNEKPYFNEPGTGSGVGSVAQKKSRAYTENIFVLTCKTTLYTLRNPPKHFEAFVADHFRRIGSAILRACGAYVNGRVGVGYYRDGDEMREACPSSSNKKKSDLVSEKFKADMTELYPQLVQEFKKRGAFSLGNSTLQLEMETLVTAAVSKVRVENKAKTGIAMKVENKAKIGTAMKVENKVKTGIAMKVENKAKIGTAMKLIKKLGKFLGLKMKKKSEST